MRLFLMTATASGFALSTFMMANQALAVQDTPTTINGVEMVCTGVGSAKDDPRWSAYAVKIVLATTGGANLHNAHVTLMKGGQEVAGGCVDAPPDLFQPPGRPLPAHPGFIRRGHAAENSSLSPHPHAPPR